MNLENVKLAQLRALTAVVEYGNFSEAGLRLGISQSAVSHAIAALEQELGVILLRRGRYGATLTPVGERILEHAQEMLRRLEEIGKEANLTRGLNGGEVRVATFRSVATHILPSVIAQFRAQHPAIAVTIHELQGCDELEQGLREGRVDISVTLLPTAYEFDTWELLRDEYLVLIPSSYEVPDRLTWEALATFPLILPSEDDTCQSLVQEHLLKLGQNLKPTYEVREDSTAVSMVRQGLGISIMPHLAAEPLPPEIYTRSLPVSLERRIGVAISGDMLHSPAVYAFLDTLKAMSRLGQFAADKNYESRRHQTVSTALTRHSR